MNRREFLLVSLAATTVARSRALPRLRGSEARTRGVVPNRRTLYGAFLSPEEMAKAEHLAAATCDVIVFAGGLFWGSLERTQGHRDFTRADSVFSVAQRMGKIIRGHTLVTHETTPAWLPARVASSDASRLLDAHITSILSHYRGQVRYWDVLNEVLAPQHHLEHGLRNEFWMRSLGASYPVKAIQAARIADPAALLGLNEYGLEDDSRAGDVKRAAMLALLRHLQTSGVTVDYLGLESHLRPADSFSDAKLGRFLKDVEQLGVRIMVTELDADDSALPADAAERDRTVADAYERYLNVVFANCAPVMVNTWGLSDSFSWQQSMHPRRDGLPQRPLPFDDRMRPKPAWDVLVRLGIAPPLPAGFDPSTPAR